MVEELIKVLLHHKKNNERRVTKSVARLLLCLCFCSKRAKLDVEFDVFQPLASVEAWTFLLHPRQVSMP